MRNHNEHGPGWDISAWRDTQAVKVARMAMDDLEIYRSILRRHIAHCELRADSIEARELLYLVDEEVRTREAVTV